MIAARRKRAEELRERYAFAGEVLTLYLALLDVHENIDEPPSEGFAEWAAEHVLPGVVEATERAGPAALAETIRSRFAATNGAGIEAAGINDRFAGWLAGADLDPVDEYLARASLTPVLEALGGEVTTHTAYGRCPRCGGLPQVGVLAASGEALVSGGRSLLCSRCHATWHASRTACPACGESDEAKLVVYTEQFGDAEPVFPHLRVSGCTSCKRYLIDVDLEKDGRAVPEVDELAALPLDLYAADQGLTKVTPNLMGF